MDLHLTGHSKQGWGIIPAIEVPALSYIPDWKGQVKRRY